MVDGDYCMQKNDKQLKILRIINIIMKYNILFFLQTQKNVIEILCYSEL